MDVLTRLEKHPRCNCLSMRSFLLLPVQRITRLPLLVDSVCHRMDTMDADYAVVMKCLHVLQKVLWLWCWKGCRLPTRWLPREQLSGIVSEMCIILTVFDFLISKLHITYFTQSHKILCNINHVPFKSHNAT